LHDWIILIDE